MTVARIMLRGALATLARRARRGLLNAPACVANYRCGERVHGGKSVPSMATMIKLHAWGKKKNTTPSSDKNERSS
jgi:hypothetical protein